MTTKKEINNSLKEWLYDNHKQLRKNKGINIIIIPLKVVENDIIYEARILHDTSTSAPMCIDLFHCDIYYTYNEKTLKDSATYKIKDRRW